MVLCLQQIKSVFAAFKPLLIFQIRGNAIICAGLAMLGKMGCPIAPDSVFLTYVPPLVIETLIFLHGRATGENQRKS
ncbi:MAG: hypothetical protein QNJ17_05820 [Desulfocapsaceae bacterium]|nr:hypothetical protein [Desulfocapsaceae bacterium]